MFFYPLAGFSPLFSGTNPLKVLHPWEERPLSNGRMVDFELPGTCEPIRFPPETAPRVSRHKNGSGGVGVQWEGL